MEITSQIIHSQEFIDFVNAGIDKSYYVGIGDPNSKILFVGKESAIEKHDLSMQEYLDNAKSWKKHTDDNTCQDLKYEVHKKDGIRFFEDHPLRKGWGRNTWSKYQKLHDEIFGIKPKRFHVNFLENVFTTEINDSPSKHTISADKANLNERKLLFKESDFIQNFPVIVLACSNYIRNTDGNQEINEIFDVKFKPEYTHKIYSKKNWFFSHYNEDENNPKLVIHTRQLSANVKSDLLKDMGEVIREHLIRTKSMVL